MRFRDYSEVAEMRRGGCLGLFQDCILAFSEYGGMPQKIIKISQGDHISLGFELPASCI
jgi:hypothetical protein